jgi:hypothetical protein
MGAIESSFRKWVAFFPLTTEDSGSDSVDESSLSDLVSSLVTEDELEMPQSTKTIQDLVVNSHQVHLF